MPFAGVNEGDDTMGKVYRSILIVLITILHIFFQVKVAYFLVSGTAYIKDSFVFSLFIEKRRELVKI